MCYHCETSENPLAPSFTEGAIDVARGIGYGLVVSLVLWGIIFMILGR